jgi:hypothetical protein
MYKLGETLLSNAIMSENDEVSEFLKQELARRNQASSKSQLARRSDHDTSPHHSQRLLSPGSVSSGSNREQNGSGNWRPEEGGDLYPIPESQADTEEPHISANTMTANLGVAETAPPTSTEPIVFELYQIESTRSAHSYAQAKPSLAPSRSQEDLTSEFSQAAGGLAPMPRYLVWQHPVQDTLDIEENTSASFFILDKDSTPVLEGILRRP